MKSKVSLVKPNIIVELKNNIRNEVEVRAIPKSTIHGVGLMQNVNMIADLMEIGEGQLNDVKFNTYKWHTFLTFLVIYTIYTVIYKKIYDL